MTVYFVGRHAGALQWARDEGLDVDRFVEHLGAADVSTGDVVIGTLPINLAAAVRHHGARYVHLSMEVPYELRGRELTADDMRACGARLEEYDVRLIGAYPEP